MTLYHFFYAVFSAVILCADKKVNIHYLKKFFRSVPAKALLRSVYVEYALRCVRETAEEID